MYSNETDALLATGGLKQEGGMVDEESGNEVPTGSTREEVRDDIDAKLSPGEFVFPADVVRYFGLEKLMEMRDEAKQGLKKMEDIGQMGNAADVENADALHGEEMEEEEPEEPAAFAAGGYVGGERSAALYKRSPIKGFEMVPMVDDNGNTIYIPYINGEPQLNVPAGYRVKTTTTGVSTAPTTPVTTDTTTDRGGDGGMGNDRNAPTTTTGTTDSSGFDDTGKGYTIDIGGFAQPDKVNTGVATLLGTAASFLTGVPMLGTAAKFGAETLNTRNVAAAKAYNDLLASESTGGAFATMGKEGTGRMASDLSKNLADLMSNSGLNFTPETIAATTQKAADTAITSGSKTNSIVHAASTLAIKANIDPALALAVLTGEIRSSLKDDVDGTGGKTIASGITAEDKRGGPATPVDEGSALTSSVSAPSSVTGTSLGTIGPTGQTLGGTDIDSKGRGLAVGNTSPNIDITPAVTGPFGFSSREGDITGGSNLGGGSIGGLGGNDGLGSGAAGSDGLGFGPQ